MIPLVIYGLSALGVGLAVVTPSGSSGAPATPTGPSGGGFLPPVPRPGTLPGGNPPGPSPFPAGTTTAIVNSNVDGGLNVRSAPSTAAPILTSVSNGEHVAVLAVGFAGQGPGTDPQTEWWQIVTPSGTTGFARAVDTANYHNFQGGPPDPFVSGDPTAVTDTGFAGAAAQGQAQVSGAPTFFARVGAGGASGAAAALPPVAPGPMPPPPPFPALQRSDIAYVPTWAMPVSMLPVHLPGFVKTGNDYYELTLDRPSRDGQHVTAYLTAIVSGGSPGGPPTVRTVVHAPIPLYLSSSAILNILRNGQQIRVTTSPHPLPQPPVGIPIAGNPFAGASAQGQGQARIGALPPATTPRAVIACHPHGTGVRAAPNAATSVTARLAPGTRLALLQHRPGPKHDAAAPGPGGWAQVRLPSVPGQPAVGYVASEWLAPAGQGPDAVGRLSPFARHRGFAPAASPLAPGGAFHGGHLNPNFQRRFDPFRGVLE